MWFFTSINSGLTTIPLSTDMGGLSSSHFNDRHSPIALGNGATYSLLANDGGVNDLIIEIDPPYSYNHMGGLSVQRLGNRSILYIPIQDNVDSGLGAAPALYALESIEGQSIIDHNWICQIPQPGDQAAWCAWDGVANRLYTSAFYDVSGPPGSSVDVYILGSQANPFSGVPLPGQPFVMTWLGAMPLFEADGHTPAALFRIQSGFVTPQHHLYLAQDDGTGMVGFDLTTGRKCVTINVDYQYATSKQTHFYQEIEGSCLFPNVQSPNMQGDIHVQVYENGYALEGENFWLKHYGVKDPAERPFI